MSMPTKGKELWQNIMHYREFDRMPVTHWCEWVETRERWLKEGMPHGNGGYVMPMGQLLGSGKSLATDVV